MKGLTLSRLPAAFGLLLAAACAGGSGEHRTVLSRPDATIPGHFGQIVGLTELTDGRIALSDFKARLFLYADFASGKVDTVGIHADSIAANDPAPGRHKIPGTIVHLAGDTLVLVDFATQRALLWDEKGKYLVTLGHVQLPGFTTPVVFDTLGKAYRQDYRAFLGGLEPGQAIRTDSAPVLRFARDSARTADTVAMLKLPATGEGQFGDDKKTVPVVFSASDVFGASPDGWVWVARATENSVDWRKPDGTWSKGAPRPFKPIVITDADKERFMATARAGGLNLQTGVRYPFAANKPPFSSATSAQDGTVWLQRSRAASDSIPVYDIIGRDGNLVRTVELPRGASLAGVGRKGAVYVLRRDEDYQRVEKYQLK